MARTRRRSQHYVHPKYQPMKKWWSEHVPIVGDLFETEEPVQYNYPREPVEAEQGAIDIETAFPITAGLIVIGYAILCSRK